MIFQYRYRRPRSRKATARPRLEGLETRIVLSSVIGTDPAPNSILTTSPTQIRVLFDTPIDEFSLSYNDVIVDRVAADGSLSPAFDDANTPYESLDPTSTQLLFDTSQSLAPGHYRLVLPGYAGITGVDGSWAANADGSDQTLADFTIARKGVGLNDAVNLGKIGSNAVSVPGSLDFTTDPSAVKLYQITLTPGHFWRLGIEVSAQRDGSSLNSALTLFDSQGKPIATNDVGRPDAPSDPFLFQGLNPGTYYIGVSGAGDLPNLADGYNPVTETPGRSQTQSGGNFSLHLVADQADLPGQLIRFSTNHADALDPTPTGFTLQFSTPLDLGSSGDDVFHRSTTGIYVLGNDGRSWPIAAVNYDAQHSALAFIFLEKMPEGRYTIAMNNQAPLRDLAGLVPVSPGMPKGDLATFRVLPDVRTLSMRGPIPISPAILETEVESSGERGEVTKVHQPNSSEDLGGLYPQKVLQGITRTFTIQPGETVAFRFVSLYQDFYKLEETHSSDGLLIDIDNSNIVCDLETGPTNQVNSILMNLGIGDYIARLTATGDHPVMVTTRISIASFSWDSLLANGLGQGPALNLRLISTDSAASFTLGDTATTFNTASSTPTSPSGPIFGPFTLTPGSTATPAPQLPPISPGASAFVASSSHATSPLPFEIGGVLVGRPNRDADHVAVVVSPEGGTIALAGGAPGFGQSIDSDSAMRGIMSSFGDPPIKPKIRDAESNLEGAIPPEKRAGTVTPREEDIEVHAAEIAMGVVPTEPMIKDEATANLEDGAGIALKTSDRSETDEAEATPSKTAWVVGLIGIAGIGVHWFARKRRVAAVKRAQPTRLESAVRSVPAPHTRPSMRYAKSAM